MERLTELHFKKSDGFYMKCSVNCCKEDFSCEDCKEFEKLVDRLGTIENILGDDYDLDHLRKLVQIDQLIGKDVWSADPFQDNKPRDGGVVGYEVYSDAVNLFVNFDPVPMTAYFSLEDIGKTVFMTREEAEEARRREQE